MNVPFAGLCLAELRKVRGRGLLYAVLLFGAAHGIAAPLLARITVFAGENAMRKMGVGGTGGTPSDSMDWLVAADLSQTAITLPIFGLVLLFLMSVLWAQDFSLGTLGMLVIRPVSRGKIFLSKVAVSWAIVGLAVALALMFGSLIGLPLFGTSGDIAGLASVNLCIDPSDAPCFPYISWMAVLPSDDLAMVGEGAAVALGFGARVLGLIQGFALAVLLHGPLIGVAALVATLTRSPVLTLFGSLLLFVADALVTFFLTLWAALDGVEGSALAGQLKGLTLWSTRGFYRLHGSGELLERGGVDVLLVCIYTAGLLGLSGWIFVRRDLD
jgi:ABC-type transport system involved in multi-copper enzyme maturation permease subunit